MAGFDEGLVFNAKIAKVSAKGAKGFVSYKFEGLVVISMNKFIILAISLVLALNEIPLSAQINNLSTVLSVIDGDTIKVKFQQQTITVRLSCIDAPELKQKPWGELSTNRLKQLLPTGLPVTIRTVDQDKYGRTVAEVFDRGRSINLEMVRESYAVVYPKYLNNCATNTNQYLITEAQAKKNKLGFWNQLQPVMPWDFRHPKHQVSVPTSPQRENCDRAYPDVCIPPYPPDLDCGDVPYKKFRVIPPNPHGFDRNRDGIGCEK